MRSFLRLTALLLLATAAFAQFDLPGKRDAAEKKQETAKPQEPAAPPAATAPAPAPVEAPAAPPPAAMPPGFEAPGAATKAQAAVAASVAKAIRKQADEEGVSHIKDRKLKKQWELKLEGVDAGKVVLADDTHAVATADFKSTDGEHALEIDYTVEKAGKAWRRRKVAIRSVDGKARVATQEKQ